MRSSPKDQPVQGDGMPVPARYWAIIGLWLALLMAVIDASIANVALPAIAGDLHAQPAASVWIINAYQLAIVVSLLPLAALGEIVTFRRVFLTGLFVFTLASVGCCFAHSLTQLTMARAVQGLGAAGVMSVNGALVRYIFPGALLGRGVGLNALVISIASVIGPSVASAILAHASWPWLFAVNVPTGLAALAVCSFALPASPKSGGRLDLPSVVLNIAAYGLVIAGLDVLVRGGHLRLGMICIAGGAAAGYALVRRSLPQTRPLIPIDLLRIPIFALTVVTSVASFTAQMLAFVALPFYFQTEMHRSQVATGLLMTAWPVAVGVAAPIAGRLADRHAAGLLSAIGLAGMAAGLLAVACLPASATNIAIILPMLLCGLGFGFFQAPNNRTLLGTAPKARAGAAGGTLATARLTGQTIGATSAAIMFAITAEGDAASLWLAAVVAAIGAGISLSRLKAGSSEG